MLGLEGYSSDEDERDTKEVKETTTPQAAQPATRPETSTTPVATLLQSQPQLESLPSGPPTGPSQGPSFDQASTLHDLPSTSSSAPGSPYTLNRSQIHSLTLPTHPNTSIPPSPPHSPRASTTTKIQKFLTLKTRGVHFNAKLASSSALANPELLAGLMEFAGFDGEDQYRSVLGDDVAVVRKEGWPRSAYWEELNKMQEKVRKRKEEEKKAGRKDGVGGVDFVKEGSLGGGKGVTSEREAKRRRER